MDSRSMNRRRGETNPQTIARAHLLAKKAPGDGTGGRMERLEIRIPAGRPEAHRAHLIRTSAPCSRSRPGVR